MQVEISIIYRFNDVPESIDAQSKLQLKERVTETILERIKYGYHSGELIEVVNDETHYGWFEIKKTEV